MSFPFRILTNGQVAQVDPTSDDGIRQDVAAIVLTQLGERVLQPAFGLPDPSFNSIEPSQLAAAISNFGPKVNLAGVDVVKRDEHQLELRVRYNPGSI